jgi:hypothetical protein
MHVITNGSEQTHCDVLVHVYEIVPEEFNCFANSIHEMGLMINGRKTEFKESKENRNTLDIVEEF